MTLDKKLKYIASGGTACPECGSKNIKGVNDIGWRYPITRAISCSDCHFTWLDVLRVCDILTANGSTIPPVPLPLNEVLTYHWLVMCQGGIEITAEGPLVGDDAAIWASATRINDRRSDEIDSPIFDCTIDPQTGRLNFVEMDFRSDSETP